MGGGFTPHPSIFRAPRPKAGAGPGVGLMGLDFKKALALMDADQGALWAKAEPLRGNKPCRLPRRCPYRSEAEPKHAIDEAADHHWNVQAAALLDKLK
jgi:hypothetical protein